MEKILNYLSFIKQDIMGFSDILSISDFNFIILMIIIIILIMNKISRTKINKKIEQIPGLEINNDILKDIKQISKEIINLKTQEISSKNNFIKISESFKKLKIIKFKKYNPYEDMGIGGNQSFSVAFISAEGNGVIMTSLYSREKTRILLKEVVDFKEKQELSKEEKEILNEIVKS